MSLKPLTTPGIAAPWSLAIASGARYVEQIGTRPQTLRQPAVPVALLPSSEAETVAGSINNPDLVSSQYNERSAQDAVDVAFGQMLPELNLTGTLSYDKDIMGLGIERSTAQVLAQVTIPLYQAGNVESQVRQAKQTASQLRDQIATKLNEYVPTPEVTVMVREPAT